MKKILEIFTLKRTLTGLILILVVMQFFTIDKTNPESDPDQDFIAMMNPPVEIANMLKISCYDCHSHETVYPWYTNLAPFSWWIKEHINHAREELNFSTWGTYDASRADHKLEEGVEKVESAEMPLPSYLIIHSESKLSDAQRERLANYFQSLRTGGEDDE
jgi:hypothetical protein